ELSQPHARGGAPAGAGARRHVVRDGAKEHPSHRPARARGPAGALRRAYSSGRGMAPGSGCGACGSLRWNARSLASFELDGTRGEADGVNRAKTGGASRIGGWVLVRAIRLDSERSAARSRPISWAGLAAAAFKTLRVL